jgi:hypothetical protein
MKKIYLFFLIVLYLNSNTSAQNSWSKIVHQPNSSVNAILADTGDTFFIGGAFTLIGTDSIPGIARWTGSAFEKVGDQGITGSNVSAITHFADGIAVGGTFSMLDTESCNNIGYWDGSRWNPLGNGFDYTGATTVSTLIIYDDELYAAGTFTISGSDTVNNIARWNSTRWEALSSGINGTVRALCIYNGELYAAGTFTNAGGVEVNNIAKWDGSNWSAAGGGLKYTGATTVSTLQVYNGHLYAGGTFDQAGGNTAEHIAKWDGTDWSDVGGGLEYTGATTVSTICIYEYDSLLIAEAKYQSISDTTVFTYQMQYWNDTSWTLMDAESNDAIYDMKAVNGTLFAAGSFTELESDSIFFIAKWTASGLKLMFSSPTEESGPASSVYPNPVQNEFTIQFSKNDKNPNAFYTFSLYDLSGKEIMIIKNLEDIQRFERNAVSAGVYLYHIKDERGRIVSNGKLIFN